MASTAPPHNRCSGRGISQWIACLVASRMRAGFWLGHRKSPWGNAYDYEGNMVYVEFTADNRRVTAKILLPILIADYGYRAPPSFLSSSGVSRRPSTGYVSNT